MPWITADGSIATGAQVDVRSSELPLRCDTSCQLVAERLRLLVPPLIAA